MSTASVARNDAINLALPPDGAASRALASVRVAAAALPSARRARPGSTRGGPRSVRAENGEGGPRPLQAAREQGEAPRAGGLPPPPPPPEPAAFLVQATAGNAALALAGASLGGWAGLDVWHQLLHPAPNWAAALGCTVPLLATCAYGVAAADRGDSGFSQLRDLFQRLVIPPLQRLPAWGLCLLAVGAGVGEETLFRAFLQTAAIGGIQGAAPALDPAAAAAAGVAASSLAFGALHALTPTYFLFATAASTVFGAEYLACDLCTAAITHWLYDWAALVYILNTWGGAGGSPAGSPDTSGR